MGIFFIYRNFSRILEKFEKWNREMKTIEKLEYLITLSNIRHRSRIPNPTPPHRIENLPLPNPITMLIPAHIPNEWKQIISHMPIDITRTPPQPIDSRRRDAALNSMSTLAPSWREFATTRHRAIADRVPKMSKVLRGQKRRGSQSYRGPYLPGGGLWTGVRGIRELAP